MNDDFAQIDLTLEIRNSALRKPWQSGLYSKILVNREDLRVVLFVMEPGATLKEHKADGSITVHVLQGEICFNIQDQDHSVRAGQLVTLGRSIRHAVEAVVDSAFLLTISRQSA
jgi:quercetin dioxygenase-like cupin family protein